MTTPLITFDCIPWHLSPVYQNKGEPKTCSFVDVYPLGNLLYSSSKWPSRNCEFSHWTWECSIISFLWSFIRGYHLWIPLYAIIYTIKVISYPISFHDTILYQTDSTELLCPLIKTRSANHRCIARWTTEPPTIQLWTAGAIKGASLGYPCSRNIFPMNNGGEQFELQTEFPNHLKISWFTNFRMYDSCMLHSYTRGLLVIYHLNPSNRYDDYQVLESFTMGPVLGLRESWRPRWTPSWSWPGRMPGMSGTNISVPSGFFS